MLRVLILLLACSTALGAGISRGRESLINLLGNFATHQIDKPSLIAYTCWTKAESAFFVKELWRRGIFSSIRNIENGSFDPGWSNRQMYFADARCERAADFLRRADKGDGFGFPARWIFTRNESVYRGDHRFLLNSRIFLVNHSEGSIETIYRISEGSPYLRRAVAKWGQNRFAHFNDLSYFTDRGDLNGATVTLAAVPVYNRSINEIFDFRESGRDSSFKFIMPLSLYVLECLNATVKKLFYSVHGTSPDKVTKMFDGMVGAFQRGIADIGGSPLLTSYSRREVVDFVSFSPTRIKFMFMAPPLSSVSNVYAVPFEASIWIATASLLALIVFTFGFILRMEHSTPGMPMNVARNFERLEALQLGVSAVCQQGLEVEPQSVSGRIASFVSLLSLLFLYTAYSANIITLLQRTSDTIKSTDDFLNSPIKLGAHDVPYNKHYMKMQTSVISKAVYYTKIEPPGKTANYMLFREGMRRLRHEFFGFHAEQARMFQHASENFKDNEKCRLRVLNFWFLDVPYVPLNKNSPYKELFKILHTNILVSGVHSRSVRRIYTKKPVCESQSSTLMHISLGDSYFAFYLIAVGYASALLCLLGEIAWKCYFNGNST